jgi:hypothetical protein
MAVFSSAIHSVISQIQQARIDVLWKGILMKNQYNIREFKAIGIGLIIFVPIGLYMTHYNYLDSEIKKIGFSILLLISYFLIWALIGNKEK